MITGICCCGLQHQRNPTSIDQQRVLRSLFPAICGAGPGSIPASKGPHLCGVHGNNLRFQLPSTVQLTQHAAVNFLPDTRLLPFLQSCSGRLTAASHLLGNVLPATTHGEHEPDHFQHSNVVDSPSPSLRSRLGLWWKNVFGKVPELVRQSCIHGLLISLTRCEQTNQGANLMPIAGRFLISVFCQPLSYPSLRHGKTNLR